MTQEAIVLNICDQVVKNVTKLLSALDDLESLNEQIQGAGITLANFETQIAADARISHGDSNIYLTILNAFVPDIVTGLKADYQGSPTLQGWAAMQKVRSR